MGDLRSLKAYQVSKRLTLDCISKYIKCCCTLTGYLIHTMQQIARAALQQQWEVEEVPSGHCYIGGLAGLFLYTT